MNKKLAAVLGLLGLAALVDKTSKNGPTSFVGLNNSDENDDPRSLSLLEGQPSLLSGMNYSSTPDYLANPLSVDEQAAANMALASYKNIVSEKNMQYRVEQISASNIAADSNSAIKKSASLAFNIGSGKGHSIKFNLPAHTKKIIKRTKQKNTAGKKIRGLVEANETLVEEDVELEVATAIIDDQNNGTFAVLTQTIDTNTKNVTNTAIITDNDTLTEVRTYNINGTAFQVSLTINRDGLREMNEKFAHKHDMAMPEESAPAAEAKLDILGRRSLGIPMKNGKKLLRYTFAYTLNAAADVGDPNGYAQNQVAFIKSVHEAQGITGYEYEVAGVIIGPSAADQAFIGPVTDARRAMIWAGKLSERILDTDWVVGLFSNRENTSPGLAGVASTHCSPYVYSGTVLGKKDCGVGSLPHSYFIFHEVGHTEGAGHEERYNSNTPGQWSQPYGSAFAYVSDDPFDGTMMSYQTTMPRYSQNGATYQGKKIGDSLHDNIRMIKFSLPGIIEWRNDYGVTYTPAPSKQLTNPPSVNPSPPPVINTRVPSKKATNSPSKKATNSPSKKATNSPSRKATKGPTSHKPTNMPTNAPTYDKTPTLKVGETVAVKYTGSATQNFVVQIGARKIAFAKDAAGVTKVSVYNTAARNQPIIREGSGYTLDPAVLSKLNQLTTGDTVFRVINTGTDVILAAEVIELVKVGKKMVPKTFTLPLLTLTGLAAGNKDVSFPKPIINSILLSKIDVYQVVAGGNTNGRRLQHDDVIEVNFNDLKNYNEADKSDHGEHMAQVLEILSASPNKMYNLIMAARQRVEDDLNSQLHFESFMDTVIPKLFKLASQQTIAELVEQIKQSSSKEHHTAIEARFNQYANHNDARIEI